MPSPRPSHAPSYVPLKGGNSRKIRDKISLDGIQQENVRLHVLVQDKIGQDRTGQDNTGEQQRSNALGVCCARTGLGSMLSYWITFQRGAVRIARKTYNVLCT
jgi:hypothetical protein